MLLQETRWREERDSEIERVRQQYKMELEGLRSRFRMMTTASMDKSPSETSLEKFEVRIVGVIIVQK